jgi:hypothetical protein
MLTGGNEILARSKPIDQWRRAGIRDQGERKRKGKAVRKSVIAGRLAEIHQQKRKYY